MAKGATTCTCCVCGKTFVVRSGYKHNRTEADNWVAWAEKYYDTCDECAKNNRNAEADRLSIKAEELGVEIIGD